MDDDIMLKLRFKERSYILRCQNTYEDIINEIHKKIKNLYCCTINYVFFNDYYQETKLFTPDSLNELSNQQNKIIEVEMNVNEENIKFFFVNYYFRLFKKLRIALLSQAKIKSINERKERAYRLKDQIKNNMCLIRLASQKQNQSSLFTSLSMNKVIPIGISLADKLSIISGISSIHNKSQSTIFNLEISTSKGKVIPKKKWYCNNPDCNKEIKDKRYLCGICKNDFNFEYFLCKSCKTKKEIHCHTQGFVEIDVTTNDFEEEEKKFLIKKNLTQAIPKDQSNAYKNIYNTSITPPASLHNNLNDNKK